MKKIFCKAAAIFANVATAVMLIGLANPCFAQETRTDFYYYHDSLVEIPINTKVALVYFHTTQMSVDTIRQHYNCLETIVLSGSKADTLYACEVIIPSASYDEGVAWLRDQSEVYDVEPIVGTEVRFPVSNVFYVKLHDLGDTLLLEEEATKLGAHLERPIFNGKLWYQLAVDKYSSANALNLSTQMGASGLFDMIDPGFVFKVETYDNCVTDLSFDDQWGMSAINACDAWDLSVGSSNIKVAIIDQGVDVSHLEFDNINVSSSFDIMNNSSPSVLRGNHGTHVAGIIFANHNDEEIAGVAPGVSLIDLSDTIVNSFESGCTKMSTAFYEAVSRGADIINCSWGMANVPPENDIHALMLEDAIKDALDNGRSGKGCIVVFSSGNYNYNIPQASSFVSYPAYAIEEILVVGAIGRNYYRAPFSCYGNQLDVVAPGESIYSTLPNQSYVSWDGTSMSAPHVSGVAALMLSVNPNLTRNQVDRIIKGTAQKIGNYMYSYSSYQPIGTWSVQVGHGLIDAAAAVEQAQKALNVDLFIKDASDDNGIEPNTTSISVSASPDIKSYVQGTTTEVSSMEYGNTYTINVTVHNSTNTFTILPYSKIKVYWTVITPTYWNGSWSNNSTVCGFPKKGTLSVSGNGFLFLPANGTASASATLTVPAYETDFCIPSSKPSSIFIVAKIDDGTLIVGGQSSDYPIEYFARDNNNIAMQCYPLSDPFPPLPPFAKGVDNAIKSIAPNPSMGNVTIEYELPEDVFSANLTLINSYGRIQCRETIYTSNNQINMQNLPSGTYNVTLEHNGVLLGESVLIIQ